MVGLCRKRSKEDDTSISLLTRDRYHTEYLCANFFSDASAPNSAKSYKTPPPTTLFSDTGDDVFLSSIQMSDSDRQHDAWLPGDHSNFTPVAENLSTPGLVVNEPQVN